MSAAELVLGLTRMGWMVATAESCTGGMVAAAITSVPGSSQVFDRGFVTYSNDAKRDMLGVSEHLLNSHGAVSAEVAVAMAKGALKNSKANIAVSITGVAGPGGGSDAKPVGLVHFACASSMHSVHLEKRFGDLGREGIRKAACDLALQLLLEQAEQAV
jgi:nicotinamide-nucleotide amidase